MKETMMLDLSLIDVGAIAEALEDNSDEHGWWLDPRTGKVEIYTTEGLEDEEDPYELGLVLVEPLTSREAYGDLEDFTARVHDRGARDLLERAIAGRGAFRRFKDTLFEYPEHREAWFRFHDARMGRRAIEWLSDRGLIEEASASRAIADRPDPDLPETDIPFDAHEIARAAAVDLKRLYGARLMQVLLFGSWARGDAHPESDIDLLVVLDAVDDETRSVERRRMGEILWHHSYENNALVSAVVVSQAEFDGRPLPLLVNVRREGVPVG